MNKSLVTNLISILFILVGYIFQNQYSNIFYSIGFFALSGSVTNWLAVQMLFEKVPFLYGSGVILDRFLDIKEGIKNLVLEELFSDDKINQFFENKYKSEGKVNKDDSNARQIIIAVRIPNVENNGIGANPIIANPITLDIADPSNATPVPLIE